MAQMRKLLWSGPFIGFIIFLFMLFCFIFISKGYFIDPNNLKVLIVQIAEFSIVAIGIGILMIAQEFDLSTPGAMLFYSLVFLYLHNAGVPPVVIIAVVLIVGAFTGLLNAFLTLKCKIPSFISTLATLLLWTGITNMFAPPGTERAIIIKDLFLVRFFVGELFSIPVQFLWFSAFAVIFGFLLHFHVFGSWVYATGGNKDAARAVGINTDRVKTICFMIVGLLSAFSAIIQVIRAGAFLVGIGSAWNLKAITACVMGGVSLFGGFGSIFSIIIGSITLSIIENGLIMMGVSYLLSWSVYGALLLAFVILHIFVRRKKIAI
ncbi:MAG: ABC transporter permease [Nitrososphaerota archaeon]